MKFGKCTYKIDGEVVTESEFDRRRKRRGRKAGAANGTTAWSKPLHCESLAVKPEHVKFQRVLDEECGVGGTHYDQNGSPVFESPGKYADYMRAHGYHHRSTITNKTLYHTISGSLLQRVIDRFRDSGNY